MHAAKAPVAAGDIEPGGGNSNGSGRGRGLALPHERDESTGQTAAEPDPVIVQAARDIAAGLVDTDLHNTPGLDAQRQKELLRPGH